MTIVTKKHYGYGLFAALLIVLLALLLRSRLSVQAAPSSTTVLLGGERIRHASPAVGDLNGNGYQEIVVGTYSGMFHVVAYNGASWSVVWSRQVADDINAASPLNPQSTNRIESAPVIADLDNDGDMEIVVTVGSLPDQKFNGGVLVYGYQNDWNFAIEGDWPQPKLDIVGGGAGAGSPDGYWDGIFASPAVGDLDGDGDLEIVVEGEDRRIHVWEHTGVYATGWPFVRDDGDPILRGGISSPALGDLDNDGLPEIVVGGNSPDWEGEGGAPPNYNVATVWALNGDKTAVPGWPQHVSQWVDSSPALGDIDGDGELEVVVGTGRPGIGGSGGHFVYAWNSDGTPVSGWPQATGANMPSSPALADLDGDGGLDVIIGCGTESDLSCTFLYAWQGDGSPVPGFPMQPVDTKPTVWPDSQQPHSQPYPPIVADIDTDGQLEILTTMTQSPGVSIVEHNGVNSTDYSRNQNGYEVILSSPLVADVDNDGLLETVWGGDSNGQAAVYIWDETGSASNDLPWPMFHQNSHRDGLEPQVANIGGTVSQLGGLPLAGVTILLSSGQSKTSGADGSYLFEELNPGQYVITPTLAGYTFLPPSRAVDIPPGTLNQDFEVAYYDISGRVTGSNGLPLAGVTISTSTGLNDVSDANGDYSFNDLLEGNYILTPTLAGNYVFSPPTRAVTLAPDAVGQDFNTLPAPVSISLNAGQSGTLIFTDTQGLTTTIVIPSGALTQAATLILTPTLPAGSAQFTVEGSGPMGVLKPGTIKFVTAGHAFELQAYVGGTLAQNFTFAQAIEIIIKYSDDDVRIIMDEDQLFLLRWAVDQWQDAAETCDPQLPYDRNPTQKTVSVKVCHLTQLSLFGPTNTVYLPLVLR